MKTEDIVPRLRILFKEAFGDFFKEYYEGDPLEIPAAAFPCIVVQKNRARIRLDATGTDLLESEVTISIIYNKSEDFGARSDKDLTEQKLREKIEGRDPVTRQFLPDTIMYLLRTNITLGQTKLSLDADWEYSYVERINNIVTSEATIQIISTDRILVTNRI